MNCRTTRTAVVTAAVAGGVGVLLLATPVMANTTGRGGGPGTRTTSCAMAEGGSTAAGIDGTGMGAGNGMRGRGQGVGNGAMTGGPGANLPAAGTLTDTQRTALAGMAEEEKLAHDVYVVLAATTGDTRFTRIAASEARHLSAIRSLLARYHVTDPTAGRAAGSFATPATQSLYDRLVTQGKVSLDAALGVGRTIEKADIADLARAGKSVTAADVTTVYSRLSAGSEHHLTAFGG